MVANARGVTGADVPQLFLTQPPDGKRMRILGFERVELQSGDSLGKSAGDLVLTGSSGNVKGRLIDNQAPAERLLHSERLPHEPMTQRGDS